jgi:hypothetical protein
LISRLYLATPPQISNDTLKGEGRLCGPLLESGKVRRVLGEACANRVVYKIRHGALRLGSLMTKRLVDLRLEVDRRPLWLSAHRFSMALQRHGVKTSPGIGHGRLGHWGAQTFGCRPPMEHLEHPAGEVEEARLAALLPEPDRPVLDLQVPVMWVIAVKGSRREGPRARRLRPLLPVGVLHGDLAVPEREDVAPGHLHTAPIGPCPAERPLRERTIPNEEVPGVPPLRIRKRLEDLGERLPDLPLALVPSPAHVRSRARLEDAVRSHGRENRLHVVPVERLREGTGPGLLRLTYYVIRNSLVPGDPLVPVQGH